LIQLLVLVEDAVELRIEITKRKKRRRKRKKRKRLAGGLRGQTPMIMYFIGRDHDGLDSRFATYPHHSRIVPACSVVALKISMRTQ
jgi:hypothetical protein